MPPTLAERRVPFSKRLQYVAETVAVYIVYGFFRLLPLDTASWLGGWLMRKIGPLTRGDKTARRNLSFTLPEADHEKILDGMWDNLGRAIGEYPHLHRLAPRLEISGAENLKKDGGIIFFSGHFANWETGAIAMRALGHPPAVVYRKPNNPWIDSLLRHARDSGASGHIEKGAAGARDIVSCLKKGEAIGMLVDQRLNEGLPIPFFGKDAMTAPAIAQFALKFGCPLYPVRGERLDGARFRVTILPAITLGDSAEKIMTDINALLEGWIRENPAQWLWTHQRWDREMYQ
jgi:KDO2-lipid IV(A) lauroyltransferase